MWEIKGENNQVKATVGSLEYNGEWMGESYVTVTVESPAPVNFEIGDYIIYRDERFEINYDPGKIKSAPRYEKGDAFKYENIKFNSLADELTRCDFLDIVLSDNQLHFTGLPKFSFYGGVKDLANRMQANLDRTYGKGTWSVVVSPEFQSTKAINISVDTIKVQGALSILVNELETYYTIKGRTITIGAAGIPAGHLFKYGKGNGLYEIEQNAEADQAIVTRLRAYGSTRNLPHRYYNSLSGADGKKLIPDNMAVQYLMLPEFPYTTQDPYIDSPNIAKLGIREGTVFFDGSGELEEIYPSIEGMTAEQLKAAGVPCNSTGALDEIVSAEQMTDNGVGEINEGETQTTAKPPTFKVTLKDLGFDINDHLTTETATLSFKTGMLGGRDFEIVGCKKIESGGKVTGYELELNRVYDDSIKLWFPYSAYNAKAGDKIVILYIDMPEVYIKANAQKLKGAATEWLSKNDYSRSIYAPKVDENFMACQHDLAMASGGKIKSLHDTLKEGMLLLFEDEDLNINASIFIDRLTIKEGDSPTPTYEVVLKEEKTVGRLDKMQNQIDSLAAGMGQGSGGYNAAQIRNLIAAYGGSMFLSKIKDDRSTGKIASDIAFEVGEFVSGASGAIMRRRADGQTELEVDRIWARVKAVFETLVSVRTEALAGEQLVTPGGAVTCSRVEEQDNCWRCFFLAEQDGEEIKNMFKTGDQARCNDFNVNAGQTDGIASHFYWRLVTGVSSEPVEGYHYIDLSKKDCADGSDAPVAGDTMVQLGSSNDPDRQSAIRISTVLGDAPSLMLLSGIDSYTLEKRNAVAMGIDAITKRPYLRCYGDFTAGDRDRLGSFLDYDSATGELNYKGRINTLSTVVDPETGEETPLGEYVRAGDAVRLSLSNEVAPVACDASGVPVSPGTVATSRATVYKGGAVDAGWTFGVTGNGCTARITPAGVINVSAIDSDADTATVAVTATKEGVTLTATMSLYKVKPGADGETPVVYSAEAGTGIVRRNWDGSYSPSSVTLSKYSSAGAEGRVPTADKVLFYSFLVDGVESLQGVAVPAGLSSRAVPSSFIPADADAVVLTLRESADTDSAILDRQTIPVMTDASQIERGTGNLLLNSSFEDGSAHWTMHGHTSVDTSMTFGGTPSFLVNNTGAASDEYRGLLQDCVGNDSPGLVLGGAKYVTAMVWTYCPAGVRQTIDRGAYMEIRFVREDGTNAGESRSVGIVPSAEDVWERHTLTIRTDICPGAYGLRFYAYVVRNGIIYLSRPQLEWGNVPSPWSPNPKDATAYLTAAMQRAKGETGSQEGGLVLATLLRLGFTEVDGEYRVMSGMSGIADSPDDIAIWCGGDMIDAARHPSNARRARHVVRHNGDGYFCGNTVRFYDNHMEIGDDTEDSCKVVIDRTGLYLKDADGDNRLAVTNAVIPADLSATTSAVALNPTGAAVTKGISIGETRNLSVGDLAVQNWRYISSGFSTDYGFVQPLTAGSLLTGTVQMQFDHLLPHTTDSSGIMTATMDLKVTGRVSVIRREASGAETAVSTQDAGFSMKQYGSTFRFTAKTTLNVSVPSDGTYIVRAEVLADERPFGTVAGDATVTLTASGKASLGVTAQTVIGLNGLMSVWDNARLVLASTDGGGFFGALAGEYGLRMTSAEGFSKLLPEYSGAWRPCYFPDK